MGKLDTHCLCQGQNKWKTTVVIPPLAIYTPQNSLSLWHKSFVPKTTNTVVLDIFNKKKITLTLVNGCLHLKAMALQKSFSDTWASRRSASAQFKNSKENANWGRWGDDGQRRARTIVITSGSQAHAVNLISCSSPILKTTTFLHD